VRDRRDIADTTYAAFETKTACFRLFSNACTIALYERRLRNKSSGDFCNILRRSVLHFGYEFRLNNNNNITSCIQTTCDRADLEDV